MFSTLIDVREKPKLVERAFLVGVRAGRLSSADVEEHLDELAQLCDTMGVPVAGRLVARVERYHSALLVGSGKAEEILGLCRETEADCLIFDDDLSPSQQRNWEKMSDICVIDRREVILDIFAGRAHTREARLQVQLARLEYSLPRLLRAWTHLERQRGGHGLRGGAGEMQLETDRRLTLNRIASIKRQLEEVRRQRATRRKGRLAKPTPVAALVGYTNAGKSSLLHALTGAEVLREDKLFATLDPTTRRVVLPNNQELLLTDTVGFIRKLPHDLVESFKATLEEATMADFIVHVVDASHPKAREHMAVTREVLRELGAEDTPVIVALNKIDLLDDPLDANALPEPDERAVGLSAETGAGLADLLAMLAELQNGSLKALDLDIPASRYDLIALLHREGAVRSEVFEDGRVRLQVELPHRLHRAVAPFLAERRE